MDVSFTAIPLKIQQRDCLLLKYRSLKAVVSGEDGVLAGLLGEPAHDLPPALARPALPVAPARREERESKQEDLTPDELALPPPGGTRQDRRKTIRVLPRFSGFVLVDNDKTIVYSAGFVYEAAISCDGRPEAAVAFLNAVVLSSADGRAVIPMDSSPELSAAAAECRLSREYKTGDTTAAPHWLPEVWTESRLALVAATAEAEHEPNPAPVIVGVFIAAHMADAAYSFATDLADDGKQPGSQVREREHPCGSQLGAIVRRGASRARARAACPTRRCGQADAGCARKRARDPQ